MILKVFILFFLLFSSTAYGQYVPPIGIPAPPFGIDEPIYSAATHCPNWPAGVNSIANEDTYDCYYVDNDSGSCTDTENTYGYPSLPRCTIPATGWATLSAGAFFDIRGGTTTPYTPSNFFFSGVGTSSTYILFTGGNAAAKPKVNAKMRIGQTVPEDVTTSYVIIDNIDFMSVDGGIDIAQSDDAASIDHVSIRNCHIHGDDADDGGYGIMVGTYGHTNVASYIVIYNNDIHDWGSPLSESEEDREGVAIRQWTQYLWVLENKTYNTSGDGIGGGHGANRHSGPAYIGKNESYNHRETCMDFKEFTTLIISENILHNCRPPVNGVVTSAGQALALHYGPNSGMGPENAWVIFNKIYDAENGIQANSMGNLYVIGNLFYDINHTIVDWDPDDESLAWGTVIKAYALGNVQIVDNTFYDYDIGIFFSDADTPGGDMVIHGNIFSNRAESTGYDILVPANIVANVDVDYSQFYYSGGNARIKWYNNTRTLATFKSEDSQCSHCPVEGDPLFVNAPTSFALQAGSPCAGANVEGPVGATAYDAFYTAYSIGIEKDYAGTSRPQGATWDIGAYEYALGGGANRISIGAGISFGAGISLPQ